MLLKGKAKTATCCLLTIAAYVLATSYRAGPTGRVGDRTGSPMSGGQICSSCHMPGNFTPVVGLQLLDANNQPVTHYTPGIQYKVRLSMNSATGITTNTRYGFQMTTVQSSTNDPVSGWGAMPTNIHTPTINGRDYVEHAFQLSANVIDLPWTAPPSNTGNITFYCAGNIVNGDFSVNGDNSAATSLTISPAGIGSCIPPVLSAIANDIRCKGDSTGAITLQVSGGVIPHRFSWTGKQGYSSSAQHLSKLTADTFTAVVTTTGGCSTAATVIIKEPANGITAQAQTNTPVCAGDSLGMAGIATGGNGRLYYSWLNLQGMEYFGDRFYIPIADTGNTGIYRFKVTDDSGCTVLTKVHAIVNSLPHADSIIQAYKGNGVDSFYVSGARHITSRLWDFGDGGTDTSAAPIHLYANADQHIVRVVLTNECGSDTLYKTILPSLHVAHKYSRQYKTYLYPNPATDKVYITFPMLGSRTIHVRNTQGALLANLRISDTNYTLSLHCLPSGFYTLYIFADDAMPEAVHFLKQ